MWVTIMLMCCLCRWRNEALCSDLCLPLSYLSEPDCPDPSRVPVWCFAFQLGTSKVNDSIKGLTRHRASDYYYLIVWLEHIAIMWYYARDMFVVIIFMWRICVLVYMLLWSLTCSFVIDPPFVLVCVFIILLFSRDDLDDLVLTVQVRSHARSIF